MNARVIRACPSAVLTVLLWITLPLAGRAADQCASCRQPIKGAFYWFKSPAIQGQVALCKPCSQLETHCSQCQVPVKAKFMPLPDGRLLCETHAQSAILDETEALRVFEETKRVVFPILEGLGVLPDRNIMVRLVDGKSMNQLQNKNQAGEQDDKTLGLTQTRRVAGGKLHHTIHLVSGMSKARLMAVASHEYTHAWLHENLPGDRQLDRDTVEGFCELVAYLTMSRLGQDLEKQVILENKYTQGQIKTMMQTEDRHRFYNLVTWMKTGKDSRLTDSDQHQVLSLQAKPGQPTAAWALPPQPTAVPDTLTLKGISGTANRRFALINDKTLMEQETGKVRVGDSVVIVRCLHIGANSVRIQVEGAPAPVELILGNLE